MPIAARRVLASSARRLVSARPVSPLDVRSPTSALAVAAISPRHPPLPAPPTCADGAGGVSGCRSFSAWGGADGAAGSGAWAQAGGVEGNAAGESGAQSGAQSGSKTTHFGNRAVSEDEKAGLVGGVFSSVANKYDVMNDVMSGGLHRLWKDRMVQALHPFPRMQHLDVAGGTGDIAFRVLRAIRQAEADPRRMAAAARAGGGAGEGEGEGVARVARVIVCDINEDMLRVGQQRAQQQGLASDAALEWVQGDAEDMSAWLPDGSVDAYSIAFGIRNVTRIDAALREAHRVLRRGGQFACLELSHVEDPLLKAIYDAYSFSVIPAIGQVITGDRASYQYLVESIRKFPRQRTFSHMMEQAGFRNVSYENMIGGVVTLFTGFKL
ncbi:hypothetical protein CLOM_g16965 [Closterium sp. NIES-68]|nr:hypothetical protein CLOM_g16965 [Closterium sp. NIES-68]GJP86457.1 hypothetical protein CLOP_g16482 [Closterium sp. NIES-67]